MSEKSIYFINLRKDFPKFEFKKKHRWVPPRSPYNLIQELLYHDPWKLLIATMFLQKSMGETAIPLFWRFVEKWSSPEAITNESLKEIENFIRPLGLQKKRAAMLQKFSEEFITKSWLYPIELYGIGKYGNDSYRIFCINEWKHVQPTDLKLILYCKWLQKNQALIHFNSVVC